MKLSILIPVYNEDSTVGDVIQQVLAVDLPAFEKEIIVVDDGSTDATPEVLKREQKRSSNILTIHTTRRNFGKGMAIRTGLKYVTGDIILIQDADLELNPEEYTTLLSPIQSGEVSVVYGSRFLNQGQHIPWRSRLAQIILTTLTNFLYGSNLTDEATAYKVFKAEILMGMNLQCIGFEFCPEVTSKLLKQGHRILEVPISYRPRTRSEGKKARYFRDGLMAVYTLLKYRFGD